MELKEDICITLWKTQKKTQKVPTATLNSDLGFSQKRTFWLTTDEFAPPGHCFISELPRPSLFPAIRLKCFCKTGSFWCCINHTYIQLSLATLAEQGKKHIYKKIAFW